MFAIVLSMIIGIGNMAPVLAVGVQHLTAIRKLGDKGFWLETFKSDYTDKTFFTSTAILDFNSCVLAAVKDLQCLSLTLLYY